MHPTVNESGNAMRDAIEGDNDDDHDKGEPTLCSTALIITIITIRLSAPREERASLMLCKDRRDEKARVRLLRRRTEVIRSINSSANNVENEQMSTITSKDSQWKRRIATCLLR